MNPLSASRKTHIPAGKLPVSIPTARLAQPETDAAFALCSSGAVAPLLSPAADRLVHYPLVVLKSGEKSGAHIKHTAPSLGSIVCRAN